MAAFSSTAFSISPPNSPFLLPSISFSPCQFQSPWVQSQSNFKNSSIYCAEWKVRFNGERFTSKLRAVAEDEEGTVAPEQEASPPPLEAAAEASEQTISVAVSPSDVLTMFFQAEGTMPDSAVPTVSKALEVHFRRIIAAHTDVNLGDCSFLDTCRHMKTCKYVHYELDSTPDVSPMMMGQGNLPIPRPLKPQSAHYCSEVELGEPQWINCDIRSFRMDILGQFGVIMADPPWDIHMELPYGTMADDEMRTLNVPALQTDGLIFLWVTGRAMELGHECFQFHNIFKRGRGLAMYSVSSWFYPGR